MQKHGLGRVIVASSVGTVIEFYDFFIFASLASTIATHFFPPERPTFAFLSTLATYGIGLAVRPFGSLAFGKLGDTVGRKTTFLVTLLMMGTATAAIGVLPGYDRIGAAAPVLLITLRIIQGLALGGEYAGAATYVAEHAPEDRRGYYTSYIQLTPTIGLFASSAIVLAIRGALGEPAFTDWGWRVPFLISLVFVAISYYIRVRLDESPVFVALREQGKLSRAPIRESYATKARWRLFAIVLFGVTAGQAVLATTTHRRSAVVPDLLGDDRDRGPGAPGRADAARLRADGPVRDPLRAAGGVSRRGISTERAVHVDLAAVQSGQRVVWRLPAADRDRTRGLDAPPAGVAGVSDRHRARHGDRRRALCPRARRRSAGSVARPNVPTLLARWSWRARQADP